MKALILNAEQKTAQVQEVTKPVPAASELLIQVHAVALNPVDSLYVAKPLGQTGRIVGSDFSGTIVSLGDSVPESSGLQPGKRVAGFLQGACSRNDRPGAFAEFLVCPWDLVWSVPDEMDLDGAAAVNLCGLTAAQSVYYRLGLEAPFSWKRSDNSTSDAVAGDQKDETTYFFIYGSSTSVGMYAAQLVHRHAESTGKKIKLFGAASKKRFEMLKAAPYQYDELVDYQNDDWPSQVRQLTGGQGVHYAFDCISEGQTVSRTNSTIRKGGRMAIIRSKAAGAWTADNLIVEPIYGAVWEGLGVEIHYQAFVVPASEEAREFAVGFFKWLSSGRRLQPNPIREMPGGLEKIVNDGFQLLGAGSMEHRARRTEAYMKPISGEKLVYRLSI